MLLPRVLVPLLCALVVGPAVAAPAVAADPVAPVEVVAAVEGPGGRLTFVSQKASSRRAGHDLARRMRSRAGVVAAQVEQPVRAFADPLRAEQWGLTRLAAERVWALGPATGQVVAVLDTGVDASHPGLAGAVLPGYDVLTPGGTGTTDVQGHGTHVAGLIASPDGDGIGGAGLGQGAKVLPVRVLDDTGTGTDGDVAKGLVWAADNGATVANLSLGGASQSPVLQAAIDYAIGKGVAVVAAAGNAGMDGDPVLYPAASPGVIAVGAVGPDDQRPAWSSSGAHLSVAAPGVGILSTVPGGTYASWSGTSMAAPFVAAAVALLRAGEPALTPAQVRTRLMATAQDVGAPGPDPLYGAGIVDVEAARLAGRPAPVEPAPVPAPVAPAPAPAPVPVEPAPVPVPVAPAPAPVPVAPAPVPVPVAPAPAPVPVEPAPALVPEPVVAPRAPVPAAAPPVVTGRTSRSAAVVLPRQVVTLAARVLADGRGAGAQRVVLERRVGSGPWTALRSGDTAADGLVSWTLRPDVTGQHRFRSGSWTSPQVPVQVRQALTAAARRSGRQVVLDGRVAPGGRALVALQVPRGSGWATIATSTSDGYGRVRFSRLLAPGTKVRLYAPARPNLLAVIGRAL